MAREIHGVARGLQDVAEDDVLDLLGIDLRTLQRGLRRDHAEIGGGCLAQLAAVGPEGRSRAVDDDDFFHWMAPSGFAAATHCPTRSVRSEALPRSLSLRSSRCSARSRGGRTAALADGASRADISRAVRARPRRGLG